ncbi:MAG: hypothetical protein P4L35_14335 [Ignavibacteriaceae bacterium]|nr:hypothetical protein [Ignavibacteriaceae bacterium]
MAQPTLQDVANDMTNWRQSRSKRGPIPDEIRAKIATLDSRYRISKIAKTLGINTVQIKLFNSKNKTIPTPPVGFVRINQPQLGTSKIECQLKRSDGTTLECSLDPSSLSKLIGDFLCLR